MSFRRYFYFIYCILVIFALLIPEIVGSAEEKGDIVVTEVAWMGTEASYSDEWVELYNTTGSPVNINGWSIFGASSGECLNFSAADGSDATIIEPHDYLIFAAHQNDLAGESGINLADIWDSTISLNNSSPGELILYDSESCTGSEIDRVNQPEGPWFAGDNSEKKTMERVNYCEPGTDSDNWMDNEPAVNSNGLDEEGNPIKGTPRAPNSAYQNSPPAAEINAPAQCTIGDEIHPDASGSTDCDGYIESFHWDLGGDGNFDDATGDSVSLDCRDSESLKVSLKVGDNYGATTFASTSIEPEPPFDVYAGKDKKIKLGSSAKLSGEIGETDSDQPVSVTWEMLDGPEKASLRLDEKRRVDPLFVPEKPGTYRLKLIASTADGVQLSDKLTVTVEQNPTVDEDQFKVKFISETDRCFEDKSVTGLRAEVVETEVPVRGAIIGFSLKESPEFNKPETTPLSFKDIKVTNLETGTAKVDFYYDQNKLDSRQREEELKLFYHRPETGWIEANEITAHPARDYVTGRIPISHLKGTPLTVAVEDTSEDDSTKREEFVTHGPNPVPEEGCIFWFNLPEETKEGKLMIYASDGKLLTEKEISGNQQRFPADGRWEPADINDNPLHSGVYFYRLRVNTTGEARVSEVKKLVTE